MVSYLMIKVEDYETALRTVESFNALSVVLPIYDEEARSVFRASFKIDMADLLPEFFRSLALIALKNNDDFELYMNYFSELVRYVKKDRNKIPKPANMNDEYFIEMRDSAKKLLNAWLVKETKPYVQE